MKYCIYKSNNCHTNNHINTGYYKDPLKIKTFTSINEAYHYLNNFFIAEYIGSNCICSAEVRDYGEI